MLQTRRERISLHMTQDVELFHGSPYGDQRVGYDRLLHEKSTRTCMIFNITLEDKLNPSEERVEWARFLVAMLHGGQSFFIVHKWNGEGCCIVQWEHSIEALDVWSNFAFRCIIERWRLGNSRQVNTWAWGCMGCKGFWEPHQLTWWNHRANSTKRIFKVNTKERNSI